MMGSYNGILVFASYCVAVIAAYTAIYFGTRVFDLEGRSRRFWLGMGALCLGSGIWSMHFVGMSAYTMPMGMTMTFNIWLTIASWVPAVLASALALFVITSPDASAKGVSASAVIMGAGICVMHYGGMYAMQMEPGIKYDALLVALSAVIAVVASGAALIICRTVRQVPKQYASGVKVIAALVMGAAICGVHYTGMAAASYPMGAMAASDNMLRGDWMGIPTAIAASVFLLLAIYIAYHDFQELERVRQRRLKQQEAARNAAFYDQATGLGNRSYLEARVLERITVSSAETTPAPFSLLYFELSDYREYQSLYGEAFAQSVACKVTQALKQHLTVAELIARYSNNSFIVMTPVLDRMLLNNILRPLIATLKKPVVIEQNSIICSWGFGLSEYPASATSSRNLIRAAQKIKQNFSATRAEGEAQPA